MRSRDTRLAVMFATAPASKVMRAFAMSTNGVSTGTPTADTCDTPPPDERAHEVDVVDHQVEHDRDVGAARIERRQPVALDEPRVVDVRQRGAHGAIEPLDVAGLQHRARAPRDREQRVGFLDRRRDRLFDQHVQPALERRRGDGVVRRRRHDDAHRVDGVEQRVERRERLDAELRAHRARRARRSTRESRSSSRAGHVAQNARVMKAERSGADHSDAHGPSDHRSAIAALEERAGTLRSPETAAARPSPARAPATG